MTPAALAFITLVFALCGVAIGRSITARLPGGLGADARDFVKVVVSLMTSMAALLLSLQLSSAKTAFDGQERQVIEVSSQVVFLDRALAQSGPASATARRTLHDTVEGMLRDTWPGVLRGTRLQTPPGADVLYDEINAIPAANGGERFAKTSSLQTALDIGKTLRLISEEGRSSATIPLLAVEVAWTTGIFILFGVLTPRDWPALAAIVLSALIVSSAIFLIAQMSSPFSGTIRISSAPLQDALNQMGR